MTTDNSTAPVQGLTDEQIEAICREHRIVWHVPGDYDRHLWCPIDRDQLRKIVRAALAAAPHPATPPVVPAWMEAQLRYLVEDLTLEDSDPVYEGLTRRVIADGMELSFSNMVQEVARKLAAAPASDADSMPAQPKESGHG